MAIDHFEYTTDSVIAPARQLFDISPQNGTDLPVATKAIYVGSGGDVAIRPVDGQAVVVLRNVVGGTVLAIRAAAIEATGTTASDLVGLA